MEPKRKPKQTSNYDEKSDDSSLSSSNKKTVNALKFHNYGSDWYVWHYLNMKCQMGSNTPHNSISFIKYGWIILLKDKTAKNILDAYKNVLQPLIFFQPCRLIMEQNSKII